MRAFNSNSLGLLQQAFNFDDRFRSKPLRLNNGVIRIFKKFITSSTGADFSPVENRHAIAYILDIRQKMAGK